MIYFASDIHLGGGDAATARAVERRFAAWLDRAASDAEAVVLAGDVFDFWFEYRRVVPKGFVRILGRLAALADRGVRVIFFTGNHDMWVTDYLARECGAEIHTAPAVLELCGLRLFVAHGDNMNVGRKPMLRFMNAVFRSRTLRWLFSRLVHPDLAVRFGCWWSASSRRRHEAAPADASHTEPLIDYARAYARTHPGVDCFVFGHMHHARDYREPGLRTLHLGSWEREPVYAVLDAAGGLRLETFDLP